MALMPTAASAADDVDLASVVRIACSGISAADTEQPLPMERLAEAILFQVGYPPSRLIGDGPTSREAYRDMLIGTLRQPPTTIDAVSRRSIRHYIEYLGERLGPKSTVSAKALGIRVISQLPADAQDRRRWLAEDAASVRLVCMPATIKPPSATPVTDSLNEGTLVPRYGIIKKIEDLGLSEEDRKKADSASVGLKRVRTTEDDGTRKTTTSLTFDGTIGLRLTGDQNSIPGFAYANYTLSRDRTKPATPLGPDERRDDKDTNGLAVGLAVNEVDLAPLSASFQASYVLDFVKGSRRALGSLLLEPGWKYPNRMDFGICRFGALKPIDLGLFEFRTQCYLAGQIDYSHVVRVGRADFKKRGDFLSAGFVVGIDVAPPIFEKSGVVGSLRYRYLPTIGGKAPDVNRWDASLKYRWWLAGGGAFDIGFTYKRGEEFKTYTKEDSLELAFGVIF